MLGAVVVVATADAAMATAAGATAASATTVEAANFEFKIEFKLCSVYRVAS